MSGVGEEGDEAGKPNAFGLTRRALVGAGAACLACLAFEGFRPSKVGAQPKPPAPTDTTSRRRHIQPDAVFRVPTNKPIVALSFDDGPDPRYTPRVLDLLDQHRAKATFFVVGVNTLAHRDLVNDMRASGHSFGNHTYDHVELQTLTQSRVRDEIDHAASAFRTAGVPTASTEMPMFRPPKGYTSPNVRLATAHDKYRTIFWDACVEHFVNHMPVAQGVERMLHHVAAGSLLLAHDGGAIAGTGRPALDRSRTMEALPLLLAGLKRKGLTVVDVPTLLAEEKRATRRVR